MIGAFQLGVVAAAVSAVAGGGSDPQWANVALLLHFDGSFVDSSSNGRTVSTVGNPTISTSPSRFGSAVQFSGSNCLTADSTPFPISGDWTLEFSLRVTSIGSVAVIYNHAAGTGYYPLQVVLTADGRILARGFSSTLSMAFEMTSTDALTTNTWYVIAVRRAAGTVSVWIDGVQVVSTPCSVDLYGTNSNLSIGAYPNGTYGVIGAMDEVRITTAARTLNSVPTAPFPDA